MYEAAFRNIDDTLWKDAGCSSELDYVKQKNFSLDARGLVASRKKL